MQKISKLEKYKLCAPKNQNKMKPTDSSYEITNLKSFIGKSIDLTQEETSLPTQPVKA